MKLFIGWVSVNVVTHEGSPEVLNETKADVGIYIKLPS